MKNTSQYDLNIGNVTNWRKQNDLHKWTAPQTKLWFQMRDRGQQQYSDDWHAYEWVWVWLDRFVFWPAVIIGAICLTFVLSSFVGTILSGRLDQILGGR